ncbi:MAG: sigma-54-dependent transcriptional regulator [Anaerolineae bacterium]
MPGTILVVDDEFAPRHFVSLCLSEEGYEVLQAETAEQALAALSERNIDLVVLDLRLPGGRSGLDVLPEMLASNPDLPVVFLSGQASVPEVVQAMKLRACDFMPKPPDLNVLRRTIAHLLRNAQLQREVQRLRANPKDLTQPFVAGTTRKMARVVEMAERVAPTNASILITGESGTGKERIAHLVHGKSNRADKSLVALNCAAIPEHLLESELFGSAKGAFTNAVARKGIIEQAEGGTLFLDEISAMKMDMQVKLLRFLEDKIIRRLGATTDIKVDVRVISASNRDLKAAIAQGSFREDLFYRLAVFVIDLPPLRDRRSDIAQLVAAYINHFNREQTRTIDGVTPEALACLEAYDWPGNVRELRNIIERAIILADGPQIGVEHLPIELSSLQRQLGS